MPPSRTYPATPQLALSFQRGPGRPPIKPDRRRKPKSVTLTPEVIARFDRWADKNNMSFSQGAEMAIRALMAKDKDNADV